MSTLKNKNFQMFTIIFATILVLTFSFGGIIHAADFENTNSGTNRNPPIITSLSEGRIIWMQLGEIAPSFDIIIDGVNTTTQYRTSSLANALQLSGRHSCKKACALQKRKWPAWAI